jgi:hypothetical protein
MNCDKTTNEPDVISPEDARRIREATTLVHLQNLLARGAHVLHAGLGVVGKVVRVWGPGEYEDAHGQKLGPPVVGLANGHRFLVDDEVVLFELTAEEVAVYEQLTEQMRDLIVGATVVLGNMGADGEPVPFDEQRMRRAMSLVHAAVTAQLRALSPRQA